MLISIVPVQANFGMKRETVTHFRKICARAPKGAAPSRISFAIVNAKTEGVSAPSDFDHFSSGTLLVPAQGIGFPTANYAGRLAEVNVQQHPIFTSSTSAML